MTKNPRVSVVIPAWNSETQLKKNLPSVFTAASQVDAEVIIVDDHSEKDQTFSYLESLGSKIRLYKNDTNKGFAATVNYGVAQSLGDIVILLNTDVRPNKDCFKLALKYFEDDTVYALNFNSGEAWMGGEWKQGLLHHFRVKASKQNQDKINPSLWASGGQGMFSRSKWLELGGMDKMYAPFYWEDTDMGYRAWKRGWQVLWAPECKVVHDHKSSVIAGSFTPQFTSHVAQRNQFLFIWKNISDPILLLSHFLYLPFYLLHYPRTLLTALKMLPLAISRRRGERIYWKRSDQAILIPWKR